MILPEAIHLVTVSPHVSVSAARSQVALDFIEMRLFCILAVSLSASLASSPASADLGALGVTESSTASVDALASTVTSVVPTGGSEVAVTTLAPVAPVASLVDLCRDGACFAGRNLRRSAGVCYDGVCCAAGATRDAVVWSIEKFDSLPIEQQVLLMQSGLMLYRAGKVYLTLSGVGIPCTIVSVVAGMGAQDLLIAALIAFVRSGAPQGVEAQNLATAMKACRSPDDC